MKHYAHLAALALLACSGSDFRGSPENSSDPLHSDAAAPRPDAPTRLEERLYDGATPDAGPPTPDASPRTTGDAGGGVSSGGATGSGGSPGAGGAPVGPAPCAPEACPSVPCEQLHVPTKPTCCTVATPDKSVCGCRSLTDSICRAQ